MSSRDIKHRHIHFPGNVHLFVFLFCKKRCLEKCKKKTTKNKKAKKKKTKKKNPCVSIRVEMILYLGTGGGNVMGLGAFCVIPQHCFHSCIIL